MSFFSELKRRNVFKVAVAYAIVAWLLLQVSDTLVPALHLPEWFNSGVAFVLIIGFPIAMIFAWAFEMTPEGIKKEKDVDRSQSITKVTSQKMNNAIIGLLVVTLGYFAIDKFVLDPKRDAVEIATAIEGSREQKPEPIEFPPTEKSIAVLPFVNLSDDKSNEYFSDGLTEELLNILSRIKELQVTGRTSSFAFKGKDEDLRSIGEKLNVKSILEGSVRKDDSRDRVRITAQLINVENGFQLWSETFDRELDDIFAIQEEIARHVTQALRVTLLGEDEETLGQLASTQLNAYDFYLQGLESRNENSFESLNLAEEQFQKAIALDPLYTPAQLGLIGTWHSMLYIGSLTKQQAKDKSLPLLTMILEREPDNSKALAYFARHNSSKTAEKSFRAALAANPRDVTALMLFGNFLVVGRERISEGMEFLQRAAAIEPYSSDIQWALCWNLMWLANRQDDSLAACARVREFEPANPTGYFGPAMNYENHGDLAKSAYWWFRAISVDENSFELTAGLATQWIEFGDLEMAEKWQQKSLELGADHPMPISSYILLLQQQEQHGLAAEQARKAIGMENRWKSRNIIRNAYVVDALSRGDFQSALDSYRIDNRGVFEEPMRLYENNPSWEMNELIEIAFILKSADMTSDKVNKLLDFAERKLKQRDPALWPWVAEVNLAALENVRGNTDAAIAYLNSAYDHNWRTKWRLKLQHWFVLKNLHNEPEYQELVAKFEADMERQREEAYRLLEGAK